jgi:hypothetical protein
MFPDIKAFADVEEDRSRECHLYVLATVVLIWPSLLQSRTAVIAGVPYE